jgi:hypothetical protein
VAVLLAVAAVAAALITLVALNSSSDASSSWQSAMRQEVGRGATAVEDIRWVYAVEAPSAYQITALEVQAEEYRKAASSATPEVASALETRAQVLDMTLATLRSSIEMAVPAYALPDGGYDPLKRLSEALADPARNVYDPDRAMAVGDVAAARSDRLMSAIVVIGLAFLFGALAQGILRARRPLLILGWLALAAGVAAALVGGLVQ